MEHHDFSTIPWTRLPALKRMAPEFYGGPGGGSYAAFYSLYGDLILPWLRKSGKKFDFACRAASLHHIVTRMRMAQDIREKLGLPLISFNEDSDDDEDDDDGYSGNSNLDDWSGLEEDGAAQAV